jgi:hypothetical protein
MTSTVSVEAISPLRSSRFDIIHAVHSSEIPIAAPPICQISRGFLPWRRSDDGPGANPRCLYRAVIRNPSQKLPSLQHIHSGVLPPSSPSWSICMRTLGAGSKPIAKSENGLTPL